MKSLIVKPFVVKPLIVDPNAPQLKFFFLAGFAFFISLVFIAMGFFAMIRGFHGEVQ